MNDSAQKRITSLQLHPHPEGGYFREIYRSHSPVMFNNRSRVALTSIYFLLADRGISRWHLVDADEVWHYYEGNELDLFVMSPDFSKVEIVRLGEVSDQCRPVHVIPAGWWQAARTTGEYTLCGCTVAPGFEFAGFRFLNEEEKEKVSKIENVPAVLL